MTALGFLAVGVGGLLIYAGTTGQSALRLVTDTLSGSSSGPTEVQLADRDKLAERVAAGETEGIAPDVYEAEKRRQAGL